MYKGFSFIICLTIVTLLLIATFRPHTAGLHRAKVSIYWAELSVPLWLLMIGVSRKGIVLTHKSGHLTTNLYRKPTHTDQYNNKFISN